MKMAQPNHSSATILKAAMAIMIIVAGSSGCLRWKTRSVATQPLPLASPPAALGSTVAPWFQLQEQGGEARDFIVYEHEFVEDTARLTSDGEDHLRQIAARLSQSHFPVIVEQSKNAVKRGTKNEFPIHANAELDLQRLQVVVRVLTAMGVPNAPQRVVIAPALSPGYTSSEGERAYSRGMWGGWGQGYGQGGGWGGGGWGGGGGGWGGGGGGGGFGY